MKTFKNFFILFVIKNMPQSGIVYFDIIQKSLQFKLFSRLRNNDNSMVTTVYRWLKSKSIHCLDMKDFINFNDVDHDLLQLYRDIVNKNITNHNSTFFIFLENYFFSIIDGKLKSVNTQKVVKQSSTPIRKRRRRKHVINNSDIVSFIKFISFIEISYIHPYIHPSIYLFIHIFTHTYIHSYTHKYIH